MIIQSIEAKINGQKSLVVGSKCYVRDVKGCNWNDW